VVARGGGDKVNVAAGGTVRCQVMCCTRGPHALPYWVLSDSEVVDGEMSGGGGGGRGCTAMRLVAAIIGLESPEEGS
jgi:hypothetical protein